MRRESMDAQSTQPTAPITPSLASNEQRQILLQEQRHLIKANQQVLEELRQTLTITYLLIGKNHVLTMQWKESKEKCT